MANKQRTSKNDPNRNWMIAGVLIIVALAIFLAWQRQAARVFRVLEGDNRVLILLRGHKMASFTVEYTGGNEAFINQVQLKLVAGPDAQVHSDVDEMRLILGSEVVVLNNEGHVVDADGFSVNPGDTFIIEMDLYGQSLGSNRLEALWIYYNDKASPVEVKLDTAILNVE
jgi:hypothetical protein